MTVNWRILALPTCKSGKFSNARGARVHVADFGWYRGTVAMRTTEKEREKDPRCNFRVKFNTARRTASSLSATV